jgi:hypothetical protein
VGKTDSLVTSIREADKNMQARSTSYFVNWEKELAAIQNEGIRANGQSRKLAVLSQCKNVHNACLTTETQASPLLSDLNDVQRFLSSDLTPGGLAAIKNTTARVNQLSASVQESVNKLVADMRALGAAMSPQIIMEKAL